MGLVGRRARPLVSIPQRHFNPQVREDRLDESTKHKCREREASTPFGLGSAIGLGQSSAVWSSLHRVPCVFQIDFS